ncbi:hypothetical protein LCGC14_2164850, partial [marine sediment metagenome]
PIVPACGGVSVYVTEPIGLVGESAAEESAVGRGAHQGIVAGGKLALADPNKDGSLVLNFALPYAYGDGWVAKPLPAKGLSIELSADGKRFRRVWPDGAGADDGERIRLFDLVRGKTDFKLKVTLAGGSEPLKALKAVGVFHHNFMVLPALLKGRNKVSLRLANPQDLAGNPLHVTYVYDQATGTPGKLRPTVAVATFAPDKLTHDFDTGRYHWPLMREIRIRCGDRLSRPAPARGEMDYSAAPWDWAHWGINFWNDFERGDRHGWRGKLTMAKTYGGSDFALDNSLMSSDGSRQLKLIRYGSFLNRDSKFRCRLYVNNVKHVWVYSRNQEDKVYYEKIFTDLKQGQWQTFEFAFSDLTHPKEPGQKARNGWFMSNVYMVAPPAEGKEKKDVEFFIDDIICYDGQLKHDPFKDINAAKKALREDPIWRARPPK